MHVSRLYIENFRSIERLDLSFRPGVNILVGRNNGGKSNIIRALDVLLGEYSPMYQKGEVITIKDFRSERQVIDDRNVDVPVTEFFLWCELTRDQGEALNYDELYKCFGFYVLSEIAGWTTGVKKYPIKKASRISKGLLPQDYVAAFDIGEDENEKEYINPKLRNQGTFEHQFDNKYHFAFGLRACRDNDEITRELRFFYRETPNDDWIMTFKAPIRNELLMSAIVPSSRDPHTQLRASSWSWYGKLMKALTDNPADAESLQDAFDEVRKVAGNQFSQARDAVNASTLKVAFPDATLHFQYVADTPTELYKNCAIYVDDGVHSPLVDKGSGIQSAIVIGLFSYYTHHVNAVTSALLCVEEPELYLHPHAQRVIRTRLQDFVTVGDRRNQVIITTHSPEFASARTGNEMLILVRKAGGKTIAREIALDNFGEIVLDANHSEVLFSDAIIICEGLEPYILRAAADAIAPGELDAHNISVVTAEGKNRIPTFVALARKLDIPIFILADFDFLLRDQDTANAKQHGGKPHRNIFSVGGDYFAEQYLLGAQGQQHFRDLQSLVGKLKEKAPDKFYQAKRVADLPKEFAEPIRDNLHELRANGIGILDGEIEDLIIDATLLDGGKFASDSVFRFAEKIRTGTPVHKMLQLDALRPFVQHVLAQVSGANKPVEIATVLAKQ